MDPFAPLKANQREGWSHFIPVETITMLAAPRLTRFARIAAGQRVLDVGCGTGVVAITAARLGAKVTGLDLTPALLARARENAAIAQVEIDWHEGDVEALPFGDASFDAVVSQFGHMFAPRPEVAVGEMLRVLKPRGTIAFSTWPPELFTGSTFAVLGRYMPLPPSGTPPAPPPQWGDPTVVRERLGGTVKDLTFDRDVMRFPGLSPQHVRVTMETTVGPFIKVVEILEGDPPRLAAFRKELDGLIETYFDGNALKQDFLLSRATKLG